jgi:hypothetical protein
MSKAQPKFRTVTLQPATRKILLKEGTYTCVDCKCKGQYSHYSAHVPLRCPECKRKARAASRMKSYYAKKKIAVKAKAKKPPKK